MKEEEQISKTLPQNFIFLPRKYKVMIFQSLVMILPCYYFYFERP